MALDSGSLIEQFIRDCETRGMSPRSIPHYHYTLKKFLSFLDSQNVAVQDVNKAVVRGYIESLRDKKIAPKTLENHLSILSSFFEYLLYEDIMTANPVLPVRRRYVRPYKDNNPGQERKLISVKDMARLINSTLDIRDRAIITLLAKTGIRRNELISLDVLDVNFVDQSIRLKPTAKRTNRLVLFDDEAAFILRRWLKIREDMNKKGIPALFLNARGDRLDKQGVTMVVSKAAERIGLHDPKSERLEDHFGPHCCRHWLTTHLRRAGMRREFIQELRGDSRREAIDIYDHIDLKELKEAYLAAIPQLGI